jgi:hypothetical protein
MTFFVDLLGEFGSSFPNNPERETAPAGPSFREKSAIWGCAAVCSALPVV